MLMTDELLPILHTVERLKDVTRHAYTSLAPSLRWFG